MIASTTITEIESQGQDDLTGVRVAVYNDGAWSGSGEPSQSSMAALYWMFRWMNATVEIVDSSVIKAGVLDIFDIVAIPGGYAYDYYLDLGYSGAKAIRDFVRDGGGYFGVCAGAFYACQEFNWTENGYTGTYRYMLNLFRGRGVGPIAGIADWPDYTMTDVRINITNGIIDLSEEPSMHSIMYYGGPYFETEGTEGITTIASYCYNDMPAMIAFEYEEGRVFLTGPHPEWDEDSSRDRCTWEWNLDDDGSEWELCKTVSLWLASINGGSTGPSSDLNLQVIIILMAGIGVIALAAAVLWSGGR